MQLKKRDWKIRVAGAEFDTIDMDCTIEKTRRAEPNKCSLTIYNLNANSRALLDSLNLYDPKKVAKANLPRGNVAASNVEAGSKAAKEGRIRVEIEAGYKGERSLLFRGDLRRAISSRDSAGWKTTIEGEDGGRSVLVSRVSETIPSGTPRYAVVKRCADAMGVGLGNILEVADRLTGVYDTGTVLDGSAADELAGILRRAKLTYSIQNGVLQFLPTGSGSKNLLRQAVVLSPETGLVGSPEKDATGELKATCLLIPNLTVGGYVLLKSQSYKGVYQVVGVTHKLQTQGNEWYHELCLLPA